MQLKHFYSLGAFLGAFKHIYLVSSLFITLEIMRDNISFFSFLPKNLLCRIENKEIFLFGCYVDKYLPLKLILIHMNIYQNFILLSPHACKRLNT